MYPSYKWLGMQTGDWGNGDGGTEGNKASCCCMHLSTVISIPFGVKKGNQIP